MSVLEDSTSGVNTYDKATLDGFLKKGFGEDDREETELDCLALAVWFDKTSGEEVALAKQAKKVLKKHAGEVVSSALSQVLRRNYQQPKTLEKYLATDLDALLAIDQTIALGLIARIAQRTSLALRELLDRQDLDLFTAYFRDHHIGNELTYAQVNNAAENPYEFRQEELDVLLELSRFEVLEVKCAAPIVLPEELGHLTELHTLDLWNRDTESISFDALATLPALRELTLGLGLRELSEDIAKLPALVALDLDGNELSELPESLGKLEQLKSLDLASNAFDAWPEVVGRLTSLEVLSLRRNWNVNEIPDAIGNLTSLRELDLCMVLVDKMSPRIGELRQLRELRVSQHKTCEVLLGQLGNLAQLNHLYMSNMDCIDKFPNVFGKLKNLEILNLSSLSDLKLEFKGIEKLEKLRELRISRCKVPKFPKGLFECENLEVLEFHYCSLGDLPEGLSRLKKLRELDLDNPRFDELPADFTAIESLESMNCSMTSLVSVPEDIGNLKRLKNLDLTWGNLTSLPDSIVECENLERLSVARNDKFSEFPANFERLEKLTFVDAYWCNMDPLREQLKELKPKMRWCRFNTTP